jgi:tungstate transport system ATP-binding protein
MKTPLLEVSGLHKRFGTRVLFDDTGLVLHAGHGYVLSGANGTGKTTLLRMLAGLETADAGQLRFRGESAHGTTIAEAWRREIVYVHQQPYLFRTTLEMNLEYGLARRGVPLMERRARASEALAWAGLADRRGVPPHKLSGGEAQRAALARARLLNPALLLLDEPTANLDGAARKQVLDLVTALCIDDHTVLIASHDPEILRLAILDRLNVADRRIAPLEG